MTRSCVFVTVAAALLAACAQTGETAPASQEASVNTASLNIAANQDISKPNGAESQSMKDANDPAGHQDKVYWLKPGLAGLYNKDGQRLSVLEKVGPYKIYDIQGGFVKISAAEDHWLRRIDLSEELPELKPALRTGGPTRPVTKFPNALEEEAKRRGIDLKKPNP